MCKYILVLFQRNILRGVDEVPLEAAQELLEKVSMAPVLSDQVCELCGKPMAIKDGRFGQFLACTGFPDCKNTKPIVKTIGVKCPSCGNDLIVRRSQKGKLFYGCSGYPACNQVYWDKPVDKACPRCGSLLVEKSYKDDQLKCSNQDCDYKE